MTALDDEMVPLALELITEFGKSVTFIKVTLGAYNPATGEAAETGTTDYTQLVSPPSPFEERWVDGELIKKSDVYVLIAASGLTFTPSTDFAVTIDTISYRVIAVEPIYSGESIAVYRLQLRK